MIHRHTWRYSPATTSQIPRDANVTTPRGWRYRSGGPGTIAQLRRRSADERAQRHLERSRAAHVFPGFRGDSTLREGLVHLAVQPGDVFRYAERFESGDNCFERSLGDIDGFDQDARKRAGDVVRADVARAAELDHAHSSWSVQ